MSELLNWVASWSRLEETQLINPHVLCKGSWGDEEFWFIVTDDGWHAWFVAQYNGVLSSEQSQEAGYLIREVGRRPHLFHFENRDDRGLVRGVFQLPYANDPLWEDDIPVAVYTLEEEWTTLLPFLRRIAEGESAKAVVKEAKQAFAKIDARRKVGVSEVVTGAVSS